jgi:penicillin-binding protein 1A
VRQAGFRGPAAGKTGTTNDGTDTWFVGYTPEVVGAVWVGFDQPRPITTVATGGRVAAPVWARMMTRYYAGRAMPAPWRPPSGVFQASVDPGTGLILAEGCQPQSGVAYREYFVRGMSPQSVCPSHGAPPPMLADYALPLPDDEEATDLATELPEELREPRPRADDAAEEEALPAEPAEAPEEPEQPADREPGEPERPRPEAPSSPSPAAPRATPQAPRATPEVPRATPTPEAEPEPAPETPAATPTPTPTPPPS